MIRGQKPILILLLAAALPFTIEAKSRCTSCARNPEGKIARSSAAKREFQHEQPCPATGTKTGPCKGYVIDHKKPLACGGADAPTNMQWQTKADAKAKDRIERKGCGF